MCIDCFVNVVFLLITVDNVDHFSFDFHQLFPSVDSICSVSHREVRMKDHFQLIFVPYFSNYHLTERKCADQKKFDRRVILVT